MSNLSLIRHRNLIIHFYFRDQSEITCLFDKKNRKDTANVTIFGFNSSLAIIVVLIAPTLFTIILYPSTFSLSWNQGRGGFLFAMAFIAAELIGIKRVIDKKRFFVIIGLAFMTIVYFLALEPGNPNGLRAYIENGAE